jgi:hypothetical protein
MEVVIGGRLASVSSIAVCISGNSDTDEEEDDDDADGDENEVEDLLEDGAMDAGETTGGGPDTDLGKLSSSSMDGEVDNEADAEGEETWRLFVCEEREEFESVENEWECDDEEEEDEEEDDDDDEGDVDFEDDECAMQSTHASLLFNLLASAFVSVFEQTLQPSVKLN